MTDNEKDIERDSGEEKSGKGKKGGGKASGAGTIGQTKIEASHAFFELMKNMGASMEQITRILRDWAHLRGDNLVKRISDFARDMSRASAHVQVQFDGKDFALVTNLLRWFGHAELTKDQKHNVEDRIKPGLN